MPHFICRWPGGDVLLASVESRQELDAILQERCEPGVCKVARYHGPLVLELKPDVPGVPRVSSEIFTPGPPCPAFKAAWDTHTSSGDIEVIARDGSSQRAHKLVLQCRLPALQGQPVAAHVAQVRLGSVPDGNCLLSVVQFLYLDDVQQQEQLTPQLHLAALACGLQRLVTLCEARFAQQLELQLLSLPGLSQLRREGVLDSFIGWACYAEQLDRQELRHLCIHALARHLTAAQGRPSWSSLSSSSTSLAQLIAASTAPPLIHRQIAADGAAVMPVPTNPPVPPAAAGMGTSSVGPGPVVSVDAETFAAAGGRLTSAEWLQLQKFRSAVAESLRNPAACPIALQQQCLPSSTLAACSNPHMTFSVKQPMLGPHKRLMDSVLRFAFPSIHTLLGSGWQYSQGGTTAHTSTAGATAAPVAATIATPTAASAAAASRLNPFAATGQLQPSAASLLGRPLTPSASQLRAPAAAAAATSAASAILAISSGPSRQSENSSSQPSVTFPIPLPVPVPVPDHVPTTGNTDMQQQQHAPACTAPATAVEVPEESLAAVPSTNCVQPGSSQESTGLLCKQSSFWASYTGKSTGTSSSAAGSPAASSAPQGPAALAASVRQVHSRVLGSGLAGNTGPRPQQLARLGSEARQSWGSGISTAEADGVEQQSAPGGWWSAALPPHMQRLLRQQGVLESWGSGTDSRSPGVQSTHQSMSGGVQASSQQNVNRQQQVVHVSHLSVKTTQQGGAVDSMTAGHQQGHEAQRGSEHSDSLQVDLSGLCTGQSEVEQQEQTGTAGGAHPARVPQQQHTLLDVPAFRESVQPKELGQANLVQAPLQLGNVQVAAACATPAGSGPVPHPVEAKGDNKACPVAALQRALVEDFVLYEEASAARQHVVGILVAIEQGDLAAGQRLLAPACAELIAATAPAAVPHKFVTLAAAAAAANDGGEAASAAAIRAAREFLKNVKGISKLLGMANSSRAALALSPAQQQQQQQRLIRTLQRLGTHLPGLSRLLANHPIAASTAAGVAGVTSELTPPQQTDRPQATQDELDLNAAVEDLLQLPELLQGLQLSVLLTEEQFHQRQQQLQQLSNQAAALLNQQPSNSNTPAVSTTAGFQAAQAGNQASTATGVTQGAVTVAEASQMREKGFQAGVLFSSILASLSAGPVAPSSVGHRLAPGIAHYAGTGAAAVPPGADMLGCPAAGTSTPGVPAGVFTPTGVGAMLAGGLLAEGGVAGDSILEDMAADVLLHGARRITCNGLYELCATLATPAEGLEQHDQQRQQQPDSTGVDMEALPTTSINTVTGHKRRLSSAEELEPAAKR